MDCMLPRLAVLTVLVALLPITSRADADAPETVRPATGTIGALPSAAGQQSDTLGKRLDAGHDWLYRELQALFEKIDLRFGAPGQAPIVVPLSPVRLGLDGQFLHGADGLDASGYRELEASLALPNIERRLKLFVTSTDVQETPVDPAEQRNPITLGANFAPARNLELELGIQASTSKTAFAAVRWAPAISLGAVSLYPFVKPYIQSGLGIGTSAGITLESWSDRWMVRSTSYADWVRDTSQTAWSQTVIFGYARAVIQEHRYDRFATGHDLACGVVARLSVSGDRPSRAAFYEISLLMKRPLRGGWLFGYIEPVMQWNRTTDWHPGVGVRMGFDALLWGLASVPTSVGNYCPSADR
jgi:hypothetical protein